MELDEAIKGRRSIRRYTDRPVPMELVREVIEAGTWAPSAKNGQQWRFTVLTGEAKRELTNVFRAELERFVERHGREASGSSLWSCGVMEGAPVVIMVWNAGSNGWESEAHSVAAAIQNMLLKAYGLGLGSLWIADIYYALDALRGHLGKPWRLMAAVALGYPTEEAGSKPPPPKMGVNEVAEFLG